MRGMLVKSKGKEGIILTPDGAFVQGKVMEEAALGDEVEVEPLPVRKRWWFALAAALIVGLGLTVYRLVFPVPWAYVTVDVGPSVELVLDEELVVRNCRVLNESARRLDLEEALAGEKLAGALKELLATLKAEGFFKSAFPAVLLLTVTTCREDDRLAPPKIARLVTPYLPRNQRVDVVVAGVDPATRRNAAKAQLSPGRYLARKELAQRGVKVTAEALREMPLGELERKYCLRIASVVGPDATVLVLPGGRPQPGGTPPALLVAPVPEAE